MHKTANYSQLFFCRTLQHKQEFRPDLEGRVRNKSQAL
jgi:hypothetical protein